MCPPPAPARLLAAFVSLWLAAPLASADEVIPLRWDQLGPHIAGRRAGLSLKDGKRLAGLILAVEATGLRMEIAKTSDAAAYPKGVVLIPRSQVSVIQLTKPAGRNGLVIGGTVGGGIGGALGVTLGTIGSEWGGGGAAIAAAVAVPTAIGLFVGWLLSGGGRHGERILVLED